uniref:Titin n=1 Tax=Neogobius melanostomus TaxID=47308 RepID=A0A8C6STM0_9GOBI
MAQDVIEAPTAIIDLKFKTTTVFPAGETFIIEADYFGKPLPEVAWLKEGKEIDKSTTRMEVKTTLTHTSLVVSDCVRSDGGHFMLNLSNIGGTTTVPVIVKVLDKPGPPDGSIKVKVISAEKCNLHWNPPVNDGGATVTHYVIEKRETSRVTWTGVDSQVEGVSYKVSKLVPGKEYIFRIAAVNKYGIGDFLETEPFIAQNPYTTPSAPSIPVASAVAGDSIVLTWERPTSDGGSEIDGYILEKRDKDGVRWTKCNKRRLNDLRFRCTGLTEGHYYQFRVCAENAAGLGTPSEPSDYIKVCDVTYPPGPPTNLKSPGHSRSTVSLSWSKPIYDGGSAITGFVVEMKEAGEEEWTECPTSTGIVDTNYTVRRLRENAEYNFRVCAVNAAGAGEFADLPESVVATEKVEPPEIELDQSLRKIVNVRSCSTLHLCVNIRGNPEPEVKWSKEGGSLSERAQIEVTPSYTELMIENVNRNDTGKYVLVAENCAGSKSAFINVRILDSPSAPTQLQVKDVKRDSAFTSVCSDCVRNSYKIENLQEGCFYFFRVLAVNEFGCGLPVETTDAVKVAEVPLSPGKITLVDVTATSAKLTWEKPDHDGGSKITSYMVEMQTEDEDLWTMCSESRALEVTIEGLIKGNKYFFRVSAANEKGRSEPKLLPAPVTVKDNSVKPVINLLCNSFSVKTGNDLKIDVPFKGTPQPTVEWRKDGIELKETSRVNVQTTETSSQITIKDATKLDVGSYEVLVSNAVGTTSAEFSVNVFERPGPPCDLKIDEVSVDFVSLSWEAPIYIGGCQISNYVVEKRDTSSTFWQCVSGTVARTSIKISRLTQGVEYQFRVAAENRYGKSSYVESDPVIAQYPFNPPGPPIDLHVVRASKNAIVILWGKPETDGGDPILGYHIECKDQSNSCWLKCNFTNLLDTFLEVTGLTEGEQYDFRVIARNAADLFSAPSENTGPITIQHDVEPPKIVMDDLFRQVVVVKSGDLLKIDADISGRPNPTVTWQKNGRIIGAKGRVEIHITKMHTSLVIRECVRKDSGQYTLTLQNAGSATSKTITCKILDRPGPPAGPLKVSGISAEKCCLSWEPPMEDGGAEIMHYTVEKCETSRVSWTLVYDDMMATTCKITKLVKGNEYLFRVKAVNKYGEGETLESDPVKALDPYTTASAPTDVEVTSASADSMTVSSFTLTVPYSGKPTPSVTWDKVDVDLRVRGLINTTSSVSSLTVEQATRDDSGKYVVKLQNPAGSASLTLSVRLWTKQQLKYILN